MTVDPISDMLTTIRNGLKARLFSVATPASNLRPGLRHYAPVSKIPSVLDGMGLVVLSTPKGVMSGVQAKKEKLGGEVICTVA